MLLCEPRNSGIIPYQEPPGNYNMSGNRGQFNMIIPYQEPPRNYNYTLCDILGGSIIPYVSGNIISYSKNLKHIKRSSHKKYIFLTFPKNSSKLKPCSSKTAGNITLPATLPTDKKISSISCSSTLTAEA